MIVFEDGQRIQDIEYEYVWDGKFSQLHKNGPIIQFIQSCLPPNSILVIPRSDGDILQENTSEEAYNETKRIQWKFIQPHYERAKQLSKIFIIGTLAQTREDTDPHIHYLYLPLDDYIFEHGITDIFAHHIIPWQDKSNQLCWRGGCSGVDGGNSIRVRFVKHLADQHANVRLSWWWSENKSIPSYLFADRIDPTEFIKYKIFFIIDGNCIASNHCWGFAVGSVPFLISNANCWFMEYIQPFIHYIPIKYDLTDLDYWIEWVNENDEKAQEIAKNAKYIADICFTNNFQKDHLLAKFWNITRKI